MPPTPPWQLAVALLSRTREQRLPVHGSDVALVLTLGASLIFHKMPLSCLVNMPSSNTYDRKDVF